MTRIKTIITSTFIASILAGCAGPVSMVYYEVLEPAEVGYPPHISSVGLLNRAPLNLNNFTKSNRANMDGDDLLLVDSLICNNLMKGLRDSHQEEELGLFDVVLPLTARRSDTTGKKQPLSTEVLESAMKKYNLDALVSLEYYQLEVDRFSYRFEYFDYYEVFEFSMENLWRVYLRENTELLDVYKRRDTIYFYNYWDADPSELISGGEVVRQGSSIFGYEFGERLVPQWSEVSRAFYRKGDPLLKEAAHATDSGNWESAMVYWQDLILSEDPKTAARAYNNLALYAELEDQIPLAVSYIESADSLDRDTYIEQNKKALEERLAERDSLLRQLKVELK